MNIFLTNTLKILAVFFISEYFNIDLIFVFYMMAMLFMMVFDYGKLFDKIKLISASTYRITNAKRHIRALETGNIYIILTAIICTTVIGMYDVKMAILTLCTLLVTSCINVSMRKMLKNKFNLK